MKKFHIALLASSLLASAAFAGSAFVGVEADYSFNSSIKSKANKLATKDAKETNHGLYAGYTYKF